MSSSSPPPEPVSPFVGTRKPQPKRPRPPRLVYAAGVVWCVIGAFGILGALVVNSMLPGIGGTISAMVPGLIALAFLYVGFGTVRGKTPDTLGNGVGSVAIGILGIVAVSLSWFEGVAAVSCVIQSLALLVAGWLALAERGDYRRWRDRNASRL